MFQIRWIKMNCRLYLYHQALKHWLLKNLDHISWICSKKSGLKHLQFVEFVITPSKYLSMPSHRRVLVRNCELSALLIIYCAV